MKSNLQLHIYVINTLQILFTDKHLTFVPLHISSFSSSPLSHSFQPLQNSYLYTQPEPSEQSLHLPGGSTSVIPPVQILQSITTYLNAWGIDNVFFFILFLFSGQGTVNFYVLFLLGGGARCEFQDHTVIYLFGYQQSDYMKFRLKGNMK